MFFSFSILLVMIILIDRFRKKYSKVQWGFQVFLCIPLIWIFTNIYFLLSRNSKLKEVDFERFTSTYTRTRCILIAIKSLAVFSYCLISVGSIWKNKGISKKDEFEIMLEIGVTVVVLLFLAF
jgi:hypothetical protein